MGSLEDSKMCDRFDIDRNNIGSTLVSRWIIRLGFKLYKFIHTIFNLRDDRDGKQHNSGLYW